MNILAEAFLKEWASKAEAENKNQQISEGIRQIMSFGKKNLKFDKEEKRETFIKNKPKADQ